MSELLEKMIGPSNKADDKENCPFCTDKSLDDCPLEKKPDPDEKVISNPGALGCDKLDSGGCAFDYTTANHHLISAKQCYAKLKRCVRMGQMAGYDINAKPNGIGLPTVANNLTYKVGGAKEKKYGKLTPAQKKTVSFTAMAHAKAQWHVGHHRVQVELLDKWAEEVQDAPWSRGHFVSYDTEVIKELLNILSKYKRTKECDEENTDNFKSDMDDLSDLIRGKLNKFSTRSPGGCRPYFVSQLAADYAKDPDRKTQVAKKGSQALSD
jgi:hypothetical protein